MKEGLTCFFIASRWPYPFSLISLHFFCMWGEGPGNYSSHAYQPASLVSCPFYLLAAASSFSMEVVLPWGGLWVPVFCSSGRGSSVSRVFLSKRPRLSSLDADVSLHPFPRLLRALRHSIFIFIGLILFLSPHAPMWGHPASCGASRPFGPPWRYLLLTKRLGAKCLSFFRDPARKKWPLRRSIRRGDS
jgi:hypothetical protein